MTIPARLSEAKARHGLTDEQAGALFGVKQQTFRKWRTGKQRPDEGQLPALADWLGVDLAELRAEWHEDRASGGLSEEQGATIAAQLGTLVAALERVVEKLAAAVPPTDPPAPRSGRSRQRAR